jgi:hypothetical protein
MKTSVIISTLLAVCATAHAQGFGFGFSPVSLSLATNLPYHLSDGNNLWIFQPGYTNNGTFTILGTGTPARESGRFYGSATVGGAGGGFNIGQQAFSSTVGNPGAGVLAVENGIQSYQGNGGGYFYGLQALNTKCPINTNFTSYASGTAYTLTASAQQLAFGTTSPGITIQNAGTYQIVGRAGIKFNGSTYGAAQTITLKLRRTNNTAADLSNSARAVTLPVLTTYTGGDVMETQEAIYTAAAGDIIQLFGSVSALPSAGSVQADSAEIIALRIN